ncbi:MAG: hypothetical protein WCX61_00145 [Candidatus Peribacteraceae bacterium]|jgi:transporter family protein
MTPQTIGLLVGGVVPAILFSFSNIFMKASMEQGSSFPFYLLSVGLAVVLTSVVLLFVFHDRTITTSGALYAFGSGASWAIGISCAIFALHHFGSPLSKLVPIFNMNTLFSVLLALWIFAEWKTTHVPQLLVGSVLIVLGGVIVSRA